MVELTTSFALGAIGMALGTLVLGYGFRLVPSERRVRYAILVAVPGIAFVAYALMALEFGSLETQRGNSIIWIRYLDWLLTTPLHVLYLGLLAGAATGVIYRALGLMSATIILGFAGAYLAPPLKWISFVAGSVAFVGVVYYTYYDFDESAAAIDDITLGVYRKLRAFLIVLWLVYPVAWVLGSVGLGFMQIQTSALVISYLDVIAKVGFGLIALSGALTFTDTRTKAESPAD